MLAYIFLACLLQLIASRDVLVQRNAVSDSEFFLPIQSHRIIDRNTPSNVVPNKAVERIFAGDPTRLILLVNVSQFLYFFPENPVYSAFLEINVSATRNFDIAVEKVAIGSADLSATTWDCVIDTDNRDGVSVCADPHGRFPGMATVSFDHIFTVRKNEPGVKRIDITELVRTGPDAILVKLDDEKLFKKSFSDDYVSVFMSTTPKIVIVQPKAHIILADNEKHPGSKSKTNTMSFRGQSITHHYFLWDARNPYPQSECNIVVAFGASFTAATGFGQGELMNERCNVYFISQHCTGLSTCLYGGLNNTADLRAEVVADLLWFNPSGLQLPKGTHVIGHDQGSSLWTGLGGWLVLQGGGIISWLASFYDTTWTMQFHCDPVLRASGACHRAFFDYPSAFAPTGFAQFGLCSQHGSTTCVNATACCRAQMNDVGNYWSGYDFVNTWAASTTLATIHAQQSWLWNPTFDPLGFNQFSANGYELASGNVQFITGELPYHKSFTSRTDASAKRHAESLYGDQIGILQTPGNDCGVGTSNPTCDPLVTNYLDINIYLGTPVANSHQPTRTGYLGALLAQHLINGVTGDPLDVRFLYSAKPGMFDDIDQVTAGNQCLPDNAGPLMINGACTGFGGQCVCGNTFFGNLLPPGTRAQNLAIRRRDMPTSHDIGAIIPPQAGNQIFRDSDTPMHIARAIENIHGGRERSYQATALGL